MSDTKPRGGFNIEDYVTVAERVVWFYEKYPEGSLQAEIVELSDSRVVVRAYAYRNADDAQARHRPLDAQHPRRDAVHQGLRTGERGDERRRARHRVPGVSRQEVHRVG